MTAPTTRETADHAELARLAEAATKGEWNRYVSGAPEWNNVTHGLEVGEMGPLICGAFEREADCRFVEAAQPSVVLDLLSEIAALRGEVETLTTSGIIEVAVRNPSVADYVQHWEGRATQAERQRDELRRALEPFAKAAGKLDGLWSEDDWRWNDSVRSGVTVRDIRRASQVLANQGADQ